MTPDFHLWQAMEIAIWRQNPQPNHNQTKTCTRFQMSTTTRPIAHAHLLGLRFPQKLWLLVNRSLAGTASHTQDVNEHEDDDADASSPPIPQPPPDDICEWSRNGTAIRVRLDRLDAYLDGGRCSIFRTRLPCLWLRQLCAYGFQRIGGGGTGDSNNRQPLHGSRASLLQLLHAGAAVGPGERPPLDVDVHEYRHDAFRRDRPHLIDSIRLQRRRHEDTNRQPADADGAAAQHSRTQRRQLCKLIRLRRQQRTAADPCQRLAGRNHHGRAHARSGLSAPMCAARQRLRTVLRARSLRRMLNEKLERCARTGDWSIELASDVFDSAADAVSGFEQREVAGYYGDGVEVAAVKAFFGEFLPTYANDEGASSLVVETGNGVKTMGATIAGETAPAAAAAAVEEPVPAQEQQQQQQFAEQIPQFHIMHNAAAVNPNEAYSLQVIGAGTGSTTSSAMHVSTAPPPMPIAKPMAKPTLTISSDYGAQALANINQFTPIQYDTSFLDGSFNDATATPNDENVENVEQSKPAVNGDDDDDDDHFEIDQFFRMKVRDNGNAIPCVAAAAAAAVVPPEENDPKAIDPLDKELQAMQQDDNVAEPVATSITTETPHHAKDEPSATVTKPQPDDKPSTANTNDIIQQAAFIDDDFFSQIRESMDVLYDKMLC